jgi:integrase
MARIAKLKIRKLKDGRFIIEEPTELHGGKRHQSTFSRKSDAELRLLEIKALKSNRGGAREAQQLLLEARLQVSLLTVVEQYIADHRRREQSIRLQTLFEQYIASKSETAHPKYLSDLRQTLNKFDLALRESMVSEIDTVTVERALSTLSNGARNNALKNVKAVFNYGIDRDFVQDNPVRKSSFARRAKHEREIIPVAKVQEILDYALQHSPEIVPYLAILFFAGVRPDDEALSLQWSDIDEKNVLWVAEPKIGDGREIPLPPNAIAWITAARARYSNDSDMVTPLSRQELHKARKSSYAEAGYRNIPQDAARHSYASYWLAANGNDYGTLMTRMGHTTVATLKSHYLRHASLEEATAYWNLLPRD